MSDGARGDGPGAPQAREDDVRHAARSGGVQVLTIVAQGISPVAQVIFARLFGTAVFGAYQVSVALLEVATRGGTGGADKAMLRYIAGARARGDQAASDGALFSGLRQGLVLGMALVAGLVLFAPAIGRLFHQPDLARALPLMAPAVVFTGAMYILIQASLGARRTRPNLIVRGLCEPGFLLLAGVGAAAAGPSLRNLAMAHMLASAATLGVALLLVGRVFGPGAAGPGAAGRGAAGRIFRARPVRGFARFSVPIGASELLNAVLQRADIVMLTAYCGARAAGIYAAAEFLGRMVANVRYAFDSIAASVFSEAIHLSDHDRLQYNLTLMTRWVISVSAPLGALAIALRGVLLGLYGPEFVAGSTAMVILVVGHLVNASCLSPWVLVVSGRSGRMFAANLFSAMLNIGLGVVLIPRFGLVGTAVAVGCSIGVLQLVLGAWVWRLQGVHPFDRRVAKPLFSAAVMLVAVLLAPVRHLPAWLAATVVLAVGLAVYAGTMLALGLPAEERALLAKLRPLPRRP